MGSFFALLQKNALDRKHWRTRQELRIAIITWIERTYHRRRRRQARLGRLTPIEYETIMNPAVSLAAWHPNCHLFVRQSPPTGSCGTGARTHTTGFLGSLETHSGAPGTGMPHGQVKMPPLRAAVPPVCHLRA